MFLWLKVNNRNASQKDAENQRLKDENEKLRVELAQSQEKARTSDVNEDFKLRIEREKALLLMEQDQDRGAYQHLLREFTELEQKNEYLEQKLAALIPGHSRSLSNASSSGSAGHNVIAELANDDQNIVSLQLTCKLN